PWKTATVTADPSGVRVWDTVTCGPPGTLTRGEAGTAGAGEAAEGTGGGGGGGLSLEGVEAQGGGPGIRATAGDARRKREWEWAITRLRIPGQREEDMKQRPAEGGQNAVS